MRDRSYLLNEDLFIDRTTERALIGLVLSQRRIPPALRDLREEHFADEAHRALWSALVVLHATDPESPDAADDERLLRDLQAMQPAGGAYIQALADTCPDLDVADLYVQRLLALYDKRRLWEAAIETLREVRENAHTGVPAHELRRRQIAALQGLDLSTPGHKVDSWADMRAQRTAWDWPGWLPRGRLVLLAAASGMGKSLLALRLAACYLRGDPWPDGSRPEERPFGPGAVLWCESEAAQYLNLERARAWGLPCERIWTPLKATQDVQLDRDEHRAAVARRAARPEVRLTVVDSLSGAGRGAENTSQAMELVQWLAELARDTHKPVLLLHHLRKRGAYAEAAGPHTVRLDDLRGYSGIVQPARIVLALDAPDPARPHLKRLSVVKSSLAVTPPPLGFYVASSGGEGASGAPQLCFCEAPHSPRPATRLACAAERLRDLLAQGPLPVALVQQELAETGLSKRTVQRAKSQLGIRTAHQDGRWMWLLPAADAEQLLPDEAGPD